MYSLVNFNVRGDHEGKLVALEKNHDLPFDVKRVYYIWGNCKEAIRGKHAHRKLEQMIVCTSGSCDFILDDGKSRETVHLDNPAQGLYIKHNIWREFTNFSDDCVIMVLASEYYDECDYIRDYNEFINSITSFVQFDEVFLNESWNWIKNPTIKKLINAPDISKEDQLEWFNSLKSKDNYFIKGIKFSQIPIGVMGLKNITSHTAEYFGYIGDVNFWGKGIGKVMLRYAINIAKGIGIDKIYLTTTKENIRAIKLYKHFGFVDCCKKGEDNFLTMQLSL